jgi:hypothetical protein
MKRMFPTGVTLMLFSAFGFAGVADDQFERILDRYSEIQASLAADSTEGVDAAAQSIHQLASDVKSSDVTIQSLAAKLKSAAGKMRGKNLEASRQEFFELSKPLLAYLHQFYGGEKKYFRYYCSMAKKGWIQPEQGTRNPYYGSSMLTCGEPIP